MIVQRCLRGHSKDLNTVLVRITTLLRQGSNGYFTLFAPSTFFYSTRTLLWGLLYFCCCLGLFILSPFNYLVQVDYFIFIMSLLWSWMLVGRLIFCMSLNLLFKPRCWVLILMIAVVVKLYFIDFKLIDYQFFVVSYIGLISGYILYHLRQTVFTVLFLYLLLQVVWQTKVWTVLAMESIMKVFTNCLL